MKAKVVILMLLLVLFTVFVYQNASENTGVLFFFWGIYLPKIVLLVITLVLGAIIGLIIATMITRKQERKKKEKEMAAPEKESLGKESGKNEMNRNEEKINKI
ncbi:MAG TPA: lipopolysaccharide assembly protein LapA domain-containing protein [Ignavibacteriaceae bacterium]|nr:lipopolysaccharide assembly protein LapA domain-containing protein [Ignavibacteriaceae bacterium]